MDVVRRLASLARSAREDVRHPRAAAARRGCWPPSPADVDRATFEALLPLLAAEVNVKRVEVVTRGTDLVTLEARPSFRALGKRFGKATPEAAEAIRRLPADGGGAVRGGRAGDASTSRARRTRCRPATSTVHRQARGDVVVRADGGVVAAIDPALTEELRQEGLAREVVSRVQRLRREAGFQVTDRIEVWVRGDAAGGRGDPSPRRLHCGGDAGARADRRARGAGGGPRRRRWTWTGCGRTWRCGGRG